MENQNENLTPNKSENTTSLSSMARPDAQEKLLETYTLFLENAKYEMYLKLEELKKEIELLKTEHDKQTATTSARFNYLDNNAKENTNQLANTNKRVDVVGNKVDSLQAEVNVINDRVTQLEEDVKEIKDLLGFLKGTAEEKRSQEKFEAKITPHEKLISFYLTFWSKLEEQFGIAKILHTGKIDVSANKLQKGVKVAETLTEGALGMVEAVPGAAVITKPIETGLALSEYTFQTLYGEHRAKRIGKMASIHPSMAVLGKIAELIARQFTEAYIERIACLLDQKAIDELTDLFTSSLKSYIDHLSKNALSNKNLSKLDIHQTTNQLISGIVEANKSNNHKIKLLEPTKFTHEKEITIKDFLQYPAYQYPAKKDPSKPHFYKKDGDFKSINPYMFHHISREEWKNIKSNDSDKKHREKNIPASYHDPLTSKDANGESVTKLSK